MEEADDKQAPKHDGHDHGQTSSSVSDHHDHDVHGHRDHSHGHEELKRTPTKRLSIALAITASFMVVEAAVSFFSGSLALLADAGHMLADAAALTLALLAQRIAGQRRTRARTYGSRRAEVLAAFANGVALALTAVWIFIEAIDRFHSPQTVHGFAMILTAGAGLLVNGLAAAFLGIGTHGHNVNTRAALAHVLSDALGSIGALIAGGFVFLFGWNRADPVISAIIAALILWGGLRLVRDTSHVLMEGSPVEVDVEHIEDTLRSVPGVIDLHDLHVWSISEGFDVLTVHLVIAKGYHGTDVVTAAARKLREVHGLDHCTIQPEPLQEDRLVPLRLRPPSTP